MVPKGWSHTTLGKVMVFKNGLNFTKADVGEEIKIVGVSDFKDLSELRSTERLESVNVASHIKDDELLTDGDLLFVRSNGNKDLIGRCLFFPEVKERLSFSGFTIRGRADKKNILPQYIAFVARSSFFKSQISQYGGGTNISNLSQQILNDIALPLPPHDEQKKIVQILSTWDKAISTTEQLLANSQQQKKALMQQLLTGQKRLLDNNGVRFSGDFTSIKVKDLVDIIYGKSPKEILSSSGDFPIYGTGGISGYSSEALCFDASVLIGRKGTIDRPVYIETPFWAIDTTFYCLPKSQTNLKWFYYLVSNVDLKKYSEASGVPSLSRETIYSIKVTITTNLEEQQKIAAVLSTADQEISVLQQKLAALKQEKKALMQQLLTGKRRV